MRTVQPTYGQYALTYVGYPVLGLMAIGGILAVMNVRKGRGKTSTKPISKHLTTKKKLGSKIKKQGKGLMAGIRGLKGRRRK